MIEKDAEMVYYFELSSKKKLVKVWELTPEENPENLVAFEDLEHNVWSSAFNTEEIEDF